MSSRERRRPRIEDVAALAGVSLGTVSNVLNRPQRVTDATRAKVVAAIEELGFVPDPTAQALAAGSSKTIGMVVADIGNSFFLDMARAAEVAAAEAGHTLLLANSDMQLTKQRTYLQLFAQQRVAGILLAPLPVERALPGDHETSGRPAALLNSDAVGEFCTIAVDDEAGGHLAARHLVETGRRKLVFAGGPLALLPLASRLRGARRAVAEDGGAASLGYVDSAGLQFAAGVEVGRRLAPLVPGELDGIVAGADLLAAGIIFALQEHGLRVPDDVSIIGYDDNRQAWNAEVTLSTLAQPAAEMGRLGATRLLEDLRSRLDGTADHVHAHATLAPTLVQRRSTSR